MSPRRLPVVSETLSRRTFLELAAQAAAVAGLSACNRVRGEILPYSRFVEDVVPGNPLNYATALLRDGLATGVVIEAREGRPIKVEGNPDHPISRGATSPFEQAALLSLYDPDRARTARFRGEPRGTAAFFEWMTERTQKLVSRRGEGLAFLLEPGSSPLTAHLRSRILARLPEARFYYYAPLAPENAYAGAALAFGEPLETHYDFTKARVIVSLDADFLGVIPGGVRYARDFASRRAPGPDPATWMSRLYAVEGSLSLTGMMADHRLRVRSSDVQGIALALLSELMSKTASRAPGWEGDAIPASFGVTGQVRAALAALPRSDHDEWVRVVAADLRKTAGECLVTAGARQPAVVHAAAHAMNALLRNTGSTVHHSRPAVEDAACGPGAFDALASEMESGRIDTLVIDAFDPIYSAPADADFRHRMKGIEATIYRGLYEDATARAATWFLPAAHEVESWGDARSVDGTVSLLQPLLAPLFRGLTLSEILVSFLEEAGKEPRAILMDAWRDRVPPADFDRFWETTLRTGVVEGSAFARTSPEVLWTNISHSIRMSQDRAKAQGLELNFLPSLTIYDGRFGDNGWLQELPDPITKLTWDNPALVSPRTAERLLLTEGDVVILEFGGGSVRAPVLAIPGLADEAVFINLGYGRPQGGTTSRGIGADAYRLRTSDSPWFGEGLVVVKTEERHAFASTQPQWYTEGRSVALSVTLEELAKGPREIEERKEVLPSLYPPYPYTGHKWGMAIDLAKCTGCSACVVACEAENNGPIVGKEQVGKGRAMHWLRIDRYFAEGSDQPEVVHQPLMCVHCENAPCEYVCPVNATVHSEEGINQMTYNRCVGTRYCSNNCPYKVRRFNYLAYQDREKLGVTRMMLMNPEVTVRSRGVMEKCTYCVQRIERARIAKQNEHLPLREGDVITACQAACPTQAIVFGDLNDSASHVARLHADPRSYALLHELGTRPRTEHLARVKNPNRELGFRT